MDWHVDTQCSAFIGHRLIGRGALRYVAPLCKTIPDKEAGAPLLILNDEDSSQIEVDLRGSEQEIVDRLPAAPLGVVEPIGGAIGTSIGTSIEEAPIAPAKPGRPRLGVVAREITLLPRHWDWLKTQPGGASVALRKLVENARRVHADEDALRKSQGAAYRFMSIMAGSLNGFEEAARALFAGDTKGFARETEDWPDDVRTHARRLANPAMKSENRRST